MLCEADWLGRWGGPLGALGALGRVIAVVLMRLAFAAGGFRRGGVPWGDLALGAKMLRLVPCGRIGGRLGR